MQRIEVPIAAGPIEPTWKSLGDHARTPIWWREAKIGIWLHWGPQSVGEDGDWYAKFLYMPRFAGKQFATVYADHLHDYGHPSVSGYKDILPLWHAERWDPDALMALYRRAGARYVIAQGMHHDNFDLWDSRYQPWNSVAIGPHRSIVGGWKQAADKQGMRFGIAFHGDYALWWYQTAFLSDLEGPQAGVPYDGAAAYPDPRSPEAAWWQRQGLKLSDLYGIDLGEEVSVPQNWKPSDGQPAPDDSSLKNTAYRMDNRGTKSVPDLITKHRDFALAFSTKWTLRVEDAISQFQPDFIYFDGGGSYPFCGWGTGRGIRTDATPRVIADLYNQSIARNGGKLEAMAFTKGNEDQRAVAVNVESTVPDDIKRDQPWQTENGLGEWFYKKGTFYDSGMVIHEMLEAVSRDGNYAINIPLTPAGELDPGGRRTLEDMGQWMDLNGEAIYNSSAWDVWGEGSVTMRRGNLGPLQSATPYTAADIRYTTKAGAVYAFLMAWPTDGQVILRQLATGAGHITQVTLLGSAQPANTPQAPQLQWAQTPEGLRVTLPSKKPGDYAYTLRIAGDELHAAERHNPKAP